MNIVRRGFARLLAVVLAALVALASYSAGSALPAAAQPVLTSSLAPRAGVTADSLPTVQLNGVVWALEIVGNTVFVGGDFTSARPAGAAIGTDETPRRNFLAFDLTTGELIDSIDPSFNAKVTDMAVSADGRTLYVVGSFTTADGQNRWRIAALDVATGEVKPGFHPGFDATINSVAVSGDVLYVGGLFSKIGTLPRKSLAAVSAKDGAILNWSPVTNGQVQGVAVTPDGSRVVTAGNFSTINGLEAKGIGAVTADSGTILDFPANQVFQNYGNLSSNFDLTMHPDGTVYGSGYAYGGPPKFFEGGFAVNAYTGEVVWLADCHGDTYDMARLGEVVYAVSHHHHCSNIGSFPDTNPRSRWIRLDAFTAEPTRTVATNDQGGYPNFAGQPSPSMLAWFPDLPAGTYTGQDQAAWTLANNDEYLIVGGEFPSVNGVIQQGLGRFAVPQKASNKVGPEAHQMVPSGLATSAGRLQLSWEANWDRDDLRLTYQVHREGKATPVCEIAADSTFWERPTLSCVDDEVELGGHYKYRVWAIDGDGNQVRGSWTEIDMPGEVTPLVSAIFDDSPQHYWRMNDTTRIADLAGSSPLTTTGTVYLDSNSAVSGDPALTFASSRATAGSLGARPAPDLFTIEAWFRTASNQGGKIAGFGNQQFINSTSYDRHIYLTNDGRVVFGVFDGTSQTLASSAGFNDGRWHQVVATMSGAGMVLYVDGVRVAARADVIAGNPYHGYWRVGGDNISSWPSRPTNTTLRGSIDEVAIFDHALSPARVAAHYNASGRIANLPAPPTDHLGQRVLAANPLLYWRLNETSGTSARDAGLGGYQGTYRNSPALGSTPAVQDVAVRFDGHNDTLASEDRIAVQSQYTHELWFNTTTNSAGRLIGIGDAASGASGNFDRYVAMGANGELSFVSGTDTLTTAQAYNDGRWHHLVATQTAEGMRLYVDGVLVGGNDAVAASVVVGHLRVGGDGWPGWGGYFDGRIDEVAHYQTALDIETVRANYRAADVSQNQPPKASLAASCDPEGKCRFNATATDLDGSVVGYLWDLGDGNLVEGPEVTHTYAASGEHQVTLTVTDDQGATSTATEQVMVTVNQPPVASFTVQCVDEACTFDATASTDPDGTIASYGWEFGDGAGAEGVTTAHRYAESGEYEVTLTVIDDRGRTSTHSQRLAVTMNQPPVPVIKVDCVDLTCTFDASASHDVDGSVTSFAWTLGDQTSSDAKVLTHDYAAPGSYEITLTATDDDGASATVSRQIEVVKPNQPPVASFTAHSTGLTLQVDASGSTDPDGTIVAARWRFGDGSFGDGLTASHDYGAPGEYQVELTVTDDRGSTASTTSAVTIEAPANQPPVASFIVAVDDLGINVDASASTDEEGPIAAYRWDFGDGTTGTGVTTSHRYASPGEYQVRLEVTDQTGASATSTATVQVTEPVNQAPSAEFSFTTQDLTVSLDATASSDPDGTLVDWHWDFGDGNTGSGVGTSHSYAAAGSYRVTLAVTDNRGAVVTTSQEVVVTAPLEPVEPQVVATDSFTRTEANWGSADIGGVWSYTQGATRFTTNGSQGVVTLPAAGSGASAKLAAVSARDVQFDLDYVLPAAPTGNGVHQTLVVRQVDAGTDYRMTVWVAKDGLVRVNLTARVDGVSRSLGDRIVPGLVYEAGQRLHLSLVVTGSETATLNGYVWLDGQARPETPSISRTDDSPALQVPGAVSVQNYLTGSSTVVPVQVLVDDLLVTDLAVGVVTPPANRLPVAAFAAGVHELAANFDATGSSDPDGHLVNHVWDFGDGSTATGAIVTHEYAQAGSYRVTLTVTDDRGDSATTSQEVLVAGATPAGALVATDSFTRQAAGWGSAELGGGWMATSGAGYLSTDGASGLVTLPEARASSSVRLNDLRVSDVRVQASFALDAAPTGSGVFQTLFARQVNGGTDYRFTVYIASDGLVRVNLSSRNSWQAHSFGDLVVSGLNWQPGDVYNMAFEVSGSPTATLSGYVWKAGTPMPTTPAMTVTDDTPALQAAGRVGIANYLTGSVTEVPVTVRWDDFEVRQP